MTRVRHLKTPRGNDAKNQFEISGKHVILDNCKTTTVSGLLFQSYNSNIALKTFLTDEVYLDKDYWDYSTTTSKYLSIFLDEPIKDIRKKVKTGEYRLVSLI